MLFFFNGFRPNRRAQQQDQPESKILCPSCGKPIYPTGRGTLLCAHCGTESVIVLLPQPTARDVFGHVMGDEPEGPPPPSRILVDASIRKQRWSVKRQDWKPIVRKPPPAPPAPPPPPVPKTIAEARRLLGLREGATAPEIRRRRKVLARELHSDLGHGPAATERLKVINAAADLLLRVVR